MYYMVFNLMLICASFAKNVNAQMAQINIKLKKY